MQNIYKVAILGGGASGLMTALTLANKIDANEIIVLEKNDRLGKKLSVTGNGRGNIGNADLTFENFHSENSEFFKKAITEFNTNSTINFFEELGGIVVEEEKKLYLNSFQANSVTDLMRFKLDELKVQLKCNFNIKKVSKNKYFEIVSDKGETICSEYLVVAMGGRASSQFGSDGSGYKILESFGHKKTNLSDGLVQLKTNNELTKQLKGIKVGVNAKVILNGSTLKQSKGELLFCDFGVSGNVIFELSSCALRHKHTKLEIDFLPNISHLELIKILKNKSISNRSLTFEDLFCGILNKQLGKAIIKKNGINLSSFCAENISVIDKIVFELKMFELDVNESLGANYAQITCGGVSTDEFSSETMGSLKVEKLYATGEVLDVDGDCGGYNLQWAWASGNLAARSIINGNNK